MFRTITGLTAALTLTLGLATTAAADSRLNAAYDFNGDLAGSYMNGGIPVRALTPLGTPEAGRFDAGDGYEALLPGFSALWDRNWSVVVRFSFDDVDPDAATGTKLRILDISRGTSDAGLYLRDGELAWYGPDGGLVASGGGAFADGVTEQVAVTHEDEGVMTVYRDGVVAFVTPSPADTDGENEWWRLFHDGAGDEEGAGEIERLRRFNGVMTVDELHALSPLDTQAPGKLSIYHIEQDAYHAAGRLHLGDDPVVWGEGTEDGSAPIDVTYEVVDTNGDTVSYAAFSPQGTGRFATGPESVSWTVQLDFHNPFLTHGEQYFVRLSLRDKAGNERVQHLPFRYDGRGPTGLGVDVIGETADRTPTLRGTALVGPGDEGLVRAFICKGDVCGDAPEDVVGWLEAPVANGRWSGEPQRYDASGKPMGDLPNGDYVAKVWHGDELGHHASAEQRFRVVDAPKPIVETPPVVAPPAPPAPPTAQELAQRLLSSGVAQLTGRRGQLLARSSKVALGAHVDRPGRVLFQLFAGSVPTRVDVRARAASRSRRAPVGVGSRTFRAAGAGKVTVKLSKRGRARLRAARNPKLTLRAIFVPVSGAPVVADQAVALRR